VVTDLVQIRQLGTSREAENQDFRRYLSAHHHRIEQFQILATEIQQQIDCTTCANCCRSAVVSVDESDIEVIAQYLGVEAEQAMRLYTIADSDSPARRVLQTTPDGCIFLDGNLCLIYEARPKACRDFPHVAPGVRSLGGRFSSLCRWASLCPIIYNALESYKHLVGYHRLVQHSEHLRYSDSAASP
jgi:Fe-S-cluster containining protein